MFIYLYSKFEKHTSADTDVLIKKSINDIRGYMTDAFSEKIKILRTNKGKPYIENCSVNIGVTHTADIVIIALSKISFGIDAEHENREAKQMNSVIERVFSEKEKEYVISASDKDTKRRRFLEIWVKKEAYIKCFGKAVSELGKVDCCMIEDDYKKINIDGYIVYIYSKEKKFACKVTDMRN